MKYLRVHIRGELNLYERLDPLSEYTDKDLNEIAQGMISRHYSDSWEHDVVDESEVPEGKR